jgi:hypothetical protein
VASEKGSDIEEKSLWWRGFAWGDPSVFSLPPLSYQVEELRSHKKERKAFRREAFSLHDDETLLPLGMIPTRSNFRSRREKESRSTKGCSRVPVNAQYYRSV